MKRPLARGERILALAAVLFVWISQIIVFWGRSGLAWQMGATTWSGFPLVFGVFSLPGLPLALVAWIMGMTITVPSLIRGPRERSVLAIALLLFLALPAALAGWLGSPAIARGILRRAYKHWLAHRPQSYVLAVRRDDAWESRVITMTVCGDRLTEGGDTDREWYYPSEWSDAPTIEDLFVEAEYRVAWMGSNWLQAVIVEFDPTYGFPRALSFVRPFAFDYWGDLEVVTFYGVECR